MGMSASQARLLSLTARLSDLELQAQTISNAKIRLADESANASRKYAAALDKKVMKVANGKDGTYQDASVVNIALYGKAQDLNSTTNKLRYIEDSAGKLVMSASQATGMGATVSPDGKSATYTGSEAQFMAQATINGNIPRAKITDANGNSVNGPNPDPNSPAYKYYQDLYSKLNTGQVTVISPDQAQDPEWLENQIKSGGIYLREFNETGGKDGKGSFDAVSWTSGDDSMNEAEDKTETAKAEAEYDTTMADIQSKDKRFDLQLKQIDTEHQAISTEIDTVKKVIDKNIERSFKIFQA